MTNGDRDPTVIEFMSAIMDALDVSTIAQLQDALVARRIMRPSQLRNLTRWVGGYNAPSFHAAVAMMQAAGMLAQTDLAPAQPEPQDLRVEIAQLRGMIDDLLRRLPPPGR